MFRILLIIVVVAIGYDAVAHQGMYTRNIWTSIVGLTHSATEKAQQLGENTQGDPRLSFS